MNILLRPALRDYGGQADEHRYLTERNKEVLSIHSWLPGYFVVQIRFLLKVSSKEQRGPGRGFHGELHPVVFAGESLFLSGMPRLVRPDFRSRQCYA